MKQKRRGEVAVTEASQIDAATRRLQIALETLESAVERRVDQDRGHAALASQVDAFDADRARLAAELDAAVARARQLDAPNPEGPGRLDAAIETIRAVL